MSGLAYVYTETRAPAENLNLNNLAKEIKYETNEIINNGLFSELNSNEISNRILQLAQYYANERPYIDIVIIYGDNNRAEIIWSGNNVNICHVESDSSSNDITISRNAIKGHLGHGDRIGKCANSQNACPPEVVRCEDQYIDNKDMESSTENNKERINIYMISGDEIEVEMKPGLNNLYVIVSSVEGEEKNFVIE